jgi:hypothetical protein
METKRKELHELFLMVSILHFCKRENISIDVLDYYKKKNIQATGASRNHTVVINKPYKSAWNIRTLICAN